MVTIAPVLSLSDHTIEVVRGRVGEDLAAELLGFWAREVALDEAAARRRLGEVLCVLRDAGGSIAGSSSVYEASLAPIGGRSFWVHRSLIPHAGPDAWAAMAHHGFHALEAEFRSTDAGPIGLCLLVDDRDWLARHPEAVWYWPAAIYAGYTDDGRQMRLRYFDGAVVSGPRPLGAPPAVSIDYRIVPFAAEHADAVVKLWTSEGALTQSEAERRVSEVVAVAHDGRGDLAGATTVYLAHNDQLGMDLWHYRVYVAEAHRRRGVLLQLSLVTRDELQRRFVSGEDTRAAGILAEVQSGVLMSRFDDAVAMPHDYTYIGMSARGDHVRVHYFPGALAP